MIIPFFNPRKRSTAFALLLVLALLLLVFTGLGVFRLYFDFDWSGGEAGSGAGQLFSLNIRGGNSFNLFTSRPLGSIFWTTQAITLVLAVLMPFFRPIGASLLALAAAGGIFALNFYHGPPVPSIPLEFELLIVFVLFGIYLLMSYFSEIRDRQKFTGLLSQYVPPELAARYSRDPDSLGLEGEAREVSVLFCDVVGFSALSEQMEPREVAQWLNAFFSTISKVVVRHHGTIDKFIGDSVMAFWGAPATSDTHAFDALAAANDILLEVDQLSEQFAHRGWPPFSVGIGISTGVANVGTLGSEYRRAYTVVGDTVNVAQRLERQTRRYGVPLVVSGSTAESLPDMLFRELDTVPVKGRSALVRMYEPLGTERAASNELLEHLTIHRKAMLASKSEQWETAGKLFKELRDDWGPAEMYDLYLRGIEQASGSSLESAS
ncbi:MAG: adenylate/guanylate cyclase domain-containing protein [Gammaproteobacteria bacterium]|nr:adenylate/guanylate cyclase domain-containing protein [Gammaproteobacteria bacterium]